MKALKQLTPYWPFLLFLLIKAPSIAFGQINLPTTSGYISTIAGNGTSGYSGDGGPATQAELNLFTFGQTAADPAGNLYVLDENNFVIREVSFSQGVISSPIGTGYACSSWTSEGLPPSESCFSELTGLAIDKTGNIFFADSGLGRVFELSASSGVVTTIAGHGSYGDGGDGGPAVNAQLSTMYGLAVDSQGNVYIADTGNNRIRKVNVSSGIITTVAGSGPCCSGYNGGPQNGAFSGDGGLATNARLNTPLGVAVDNSGNIYIADNDNNRIREVSASTGVITTFAGSSILGYSGDGGPATSAVLDGPWGVAVDAAGDVYIADVGNSRIREVVGSTSNIFTVAGNGNSGYSGDGGPATSAQLVAQNVSLDSRGNIYVWDSTDDVVRAINNPIIESVLDPQYQVTSIIYAAPGNKSSAGYGSSTSVGTTTTLGSSISNTTSVVFTEGFMPFGTGGSATESFGVGVSKSNSTAFTETYTDATSIANQSVSSNPNTVNHGQDEILIWLNPELTFSLSQSTPVSYRVSTQTSATGQVQSPDIVQITASTMQANAQGQTTIEPEYLNPQTLPSGTNGVQSTLPGLAAICKNLKLQEYQNKACTLADQCGCTPSDFTTILAQDPLLNYQGTGLPYPGIVSPLEADASGAATCQYPNTQADCRYVPVPQTPGGVAPATEILQGPQCATCDNFANTFTQTDATASTQTLAGQTNESIGAGFKAGSPVFSLSVTNTITWTQLQSMGSTNGVGSSQTITFNSSTVGCNENVAIYEDTIYHTFVFQEPTNTAGTGPVCQ